MAPGQIDMTDEWSNMLDILRGGTVAEVSFAVRQVIKHIVKLEKRIEELESINREPD